MVDPRSQEDNAIERAELQRPKFQTADDPAEQYDIRSRRQGSMLFSQLSGRSMLSGSMHRNSTPQLARLSSVVGPVTDSRGLGSLAAYVLPGMLRNASTSIPFDRRASATQLFSSQSLYEDMNLSGDLGADRQHRNSGRGGPRASTAPGQWPQGILHHELWGSAAAAGLTIVMGLERSIEPCIGMSCL